MHHKRSNTRWRN